MLNLLALTFSSLNSVLSLQTLNKKKVFNHDRPFGGIMVIIS